jgi:hypothetical protein
MNTDLNIDTVKKFYHELAAFNLRAALELLDDAFELVQAESLPYGGTYRGKSGVEAFFTRFFAFWKSFESAEVCYFANGDTVVVSSLAKGTTQQGTTLEMPMVQVYQLQHRKLLHVRPFYFDTAALKM